MKRVEIEISKTKMKLTVLGSLIFVGIGIFLLINTPKTENVFFGSFTLIFLIAIANIVFFGLIGILVFRKLMENKMGLIIDEKGIIDNSSGLSVGLVLWSDIDSIKETKVFNQKFVSLILRNPQEYIAKVKSGFKRKGMYTNLKMVGSPINISSNSLKISFMDLHHLLVEKWQESKGI